MDNQLDPDAVNLAKAIRQTESGGNFKAGGKSGEYGAYQFTQPTWEGASKKYGVNVPLKQATPEQQNEVAYKQIKEWKDKGYNPGQIASMWNAGEGEPDAYTGMFSNGKPSGGTNSYGVHYDVPAYVKSVANAYQTIKGGGQVGIDPSNPSSTANTGPVKDTIVGGTTEQNPERQKLVSEGEAVSVNPNKTKPTFGGGILRDLIKLPLEAALTVPEAFTGGKPVTVHSKYLGDTSGIGGTITKKSEKIADRLKNGEITPAGAVTRVFGNAALESGKLYSSGEGASAFKKLGSGLMENLIPKSGLKNPEVEKILKSSLLKGETLANLSRKDAIEYLTNYLKENPITEIGGKIEKSVLKALEELNPSKVAKDGILKRLMKTGGREITRFALYNTLGSKLGKVAHDIIH